MFNPLSKFFILKIDIIKFYLRDENSMPAPGKHETITKKKKNEK